MANMDLVSFARKFLEAHNHRNFDQVINEWVSDQLEITSCATDRVLRGKEGFRQYFQNWDSAIPDGKVQPIRIVQSGDIVIIEAQGQGTQTNPLVTPYGLLPGSGRKVNLRFCDIIEFKDGKMVSFHNYFDLGTLFDQAGVKWDFLRMEKKAA